MATLDELIVRIGVNASGLVSGMQQATATTQQQAKRMESAFAGVGGAVKSLGQALAAYASLNYFKGIVDAVDRLNDLSTQLNVSTESLSQFQYAAKLSGTSLEEVAQGLRFLGNNISDAAANTGTAKDALKSMGIQARELIDLPLDKQFDAVAQALNGVSNQGDKLSYIKDILGRQGASLLPLIEQWKELKAEADAVGYTLNDETAQAFAALNDEIDRMTLASQVMARNFLELVVPALTETMAGVNELFAGMENTSKLFNSMAAGGIRFGAMVGLIDDDVAGEAMKIAGENILKGDAKRAITPSGRGTTGSASSRKPAEKEGKKKEAEDYDAAGDALADYLTKLQNELELAQLTGKAQAIRRAELEATTTAIKDGNLPSQEMIDRLKETAGATYDAEQALKKLTDAQEEAKRFQGELKDKFSETLSEIVLNFDNAADAAGRFAQAIAKMVIEKQITGPLADSLGGLIGGSLFGGQSADFVGPSQPGLFDQLGSLISGARAEGGPVGSGLSYLVGERGPEIFTPSASGYITANDKLGGGGITVNHVWNISPGIQGTVRAELMNAIPSIVAASKNAVIDAAQRGGNDSRILGRRG